MNSCRRRNFLKYNLVRGNLVLKGKFPQGISTIRVDSYMDAQPWARAVPVGISKVVRLPQSPQMGPRSGPKAQPAVGYGPDL